MAIVQNTLIGKTRQSVGGTTFSTWKGLNVLKSKPISVANPKTPAQELQRAKFKQAVAFFRANAAMLQIGFVSQAVQKSHYNAFVSVNIKGGAFDGTAGKAVGVLANLQTSKGTITKNAASDFEVTDGEDSITIEYPETLAGSQQATDNLSVLALDVNGNIVASAVNAALRSAGTFELEIPAPATVASVKALYVFFYNDSAKQASDSIYIAH